MTLLRIFLESDRRGGFWVQHRTWQNICALAQPVDGGGGGGGGGGGDKREPTPGARAAAAGPREIELRAFDVRSGRPIEVGAWGPAPDDGHYTRIADPPWSHPRPRHFPRRPTAPRPRA